MSGISSHVLDLTAGRPAVDLAIRLERQDPSGAWQPLGAGRTDANGRVGALVPDGSSPEVVPHRLLFDTGAWFRARGMPEFYPEVIVQFLPEAGGHYHVPLLLSPFGYSTYRGS